jgi:hypothetical protein
LGGVYNEEQLNLYLVLEALFNLFDWDDWIWIQTETTEFCIEPRWLNLCFNLKLDHLNSFQDDQILVLTKMTKSAF